MKKDRRLSDLDRKLGVAIVSCTECKLEFYSLHKDDLYCPYCEMYGFKNPIKIQKRGRN